MTSPYINGQKTYKCRLCRDDGRVSCWHPKDVRFFVDTGELPERRSGGATYACSCAAGDKWATGQLRRYDPARCVLLHKGRAFAPESEQNLRDWIQDHSTSGVVGVEEWQP